MKHSSILCPSSVCTEGAELIGIVNSEGTVDFLKKSMTVTEDFVQTASEGRPAEQRFRFSNKCVENGCKQWNGKGCGVIDFVVDMIKTEEQLLQLPTCSIRSQCRWYLQQGAKACAACPLIVTDTADISA